jgi:peptide/nickel transport system substrate-binding protein
MKLDEPGTVSDDFLGPPDAPPTLSRRHLVRGGLASGLALFTSLGVGASLGSLHDRRHASAAPSRQASPATFTLATNRTPSDLDPHSAYDAGSGMVLQGPFEGLIRLKPGTADEIVPVLAASWAANADASVWTFQLRDGVTFHDGTPLDAEAARASFERLLRLGLAPSSVLGRFIHDPAMISAPDSRTLVFDLGRPQPLFEAALASAYGTAIVNVAALRRHEVDGDWGHAWAQTASDGVGTGPYPIVNFDTESGVVLERYDNYWGGWEGDHFDQVVIRVVVEPETRRALIENGDVDMATTLPLGAIRELEQNPDLIVDRRYNLAVQYLALTVAGPLASPAARQALCWAFPYNEVIEGVYEGFAKRAVGPVAELCRGFAPETVLYQTDLGRARSLLRDAGVAEGTILTLLLPAGNQDSAAVVELFQANLAQIGVTLDIRVIDFATYVGLAFGDVPAEERPNLFPVFWQPDYNDGWNQLWPQVSCEAWQTGNVGHYCNPRVETLLDQAKSAVDTASYQAALSEIQQIVTHDDPAAIYLAQAEWLTVLRQDIAGFAPDLVTSGIVDFYDLYRRLTVPL